MKLLEFVEGGTARWEELAVLVERAGNRPERLGAAGILRLAGLYRSAVADLAYARRRFPLDPVTARLEALVVPARAAVYQGTGRRSGTVSFFADTYWRLLWDRRRPLGLAAGLLVFSGLVGAAWAALDPDSLTGRLPAGFLWVLEADSTDQGYGAAGLVGFSTTVLTNNVRVALTAFALGVTAGVGTAWILFQNGLILGGVAGLAVAAGNGRLLLAAIAAHGVLEISAIVVAGASGLSVGRALLRPGKLTRRASLAREGTRAAQIAVGTAPWLVLAGFVEGFASRTGLSWAPTTAIGLALGAAYWGLAAWRARVFAASPPTSRGRDL